MHQFRHREAEQVERTRRIAIDDIETILLCIVVLVFTVRIGTVPIKLAAAALTCDGDEHGLREHVTPGILVH